MRDRNYILYDWYIRGYNEALNGEKLKIFRFNNVTYFVQDIIWAYEKGYAAGLIERQSKKIRPEAK